MVTLLIFSVRIVNIMLFLCYVVTHHIDKISSTVWLIIVMLVYLHIELWIEDDHSGLVYIKSLRPI